MQTESPQTGSGADIKPSLRLAARPSFFLACVWTSWAFRIIVTATARTRRARGIRWTCVALRPLDGRHSGRKEYVAVLRLRSCSCKVSVIHRRKARDAESLMVRHNRGVRSVQPSRQANAHELLLHQCPAAPAASAAPDRHAVWPRRRRQGPLEASRCFRRYVAPAGTQHHRRRRHRGAQPERVRGLPPPPNPLSSRSRAPSKPLASPASPLSQAAHSQATAQSSTTSAVRRSGALRCELPHSFRHACEASRRGLEPR